MKPDSVDLSILKTLIDDGRASMRQIAQRTALSTPTVSARIARMRKAGLIRGFVPILSSSSLDRRAIALVTLKVPPSRVEIVAKKLARLPEVEDAYVVAGPYVLLKLALESPQILQKFLADNASLGSDVELASTQVVTEIIKEGPVTLEAAKLTIRLKCDYCDGDISSGRPFRVRVNKSDRYFCCKTCKRAYLEKYALRLSKLRQLARPTLHS